MYVAIPLRVETLVLQPTAFLITLKMSSKRGEMCTQMLEKR